MIPSLSLAWCQSRGLSRKKLEQNFGIKFKLQFSSEIDPCLRNWCTKHYECVLIAFRARLHGMTCTGNYRRGWLPRFSPAKGPAKWCLTDPFHMKDRHVTYVVNDGM